MLLSNSYFKEIQNIYRQYITEKTNCPVTEIIFSFIKKKSKFYFLIAKTLSFDVIDFKGLWICLAIVLAISIILKFIPLKFLKVSSTLEAKVDTKRKIKEKYEERTTKLLSITNKLLERNESAFSLSVDQFKESLNYNNTISNQVLSQVESLQQKIHHFQE